MAFVRLCYHSVNLNAWVVLLPTFAGLSCTRSPPQTLRVSIGTSIHAPASTDFFTQKGPRRRFRLTPPISSLATVCASCILLLFIFRWAGPLSQSLFNPPARPYARFYSGPGWWKGEKEHCPYLPSSAFLSAFGTRANSAFTRACVFCCSNCVCPALIF